MITTPESCLYYYYNDVGSKTRPPVLETGSYVPWASRFKHYIERERETRKFLKHSIDDGPYQMKMIQPNLDEPPRLQNEDDFTGDDLKQYEADIEAMNLILISIPNDIYNSVDVCQNARDMWDRGGRIARRSYNTYKESTESSNVQKKTGNVQRTLRTSSSGNATNVQCYNCNCKVHYARDYPKPRVRDFKYFMEQMFLAKKDKAEVILSNDQNDFLLADAAQMEEIEELSANICMMARIQQANTDSNEGPSYDSAFINECDAFDSDVDDEPTAQSIFMANLSSTGPANLQAGPSNASILSEVHDLENTIDHCDDNQDEHETHNEVQQKHVIDSNGADMGNSNVVLYEQYLTINEVSVEPSCASSVSNDAYVLHDNNAYIPHDPLVTELNIYKQQVAMYKQRAKFDLRLREL
ncbi:hypothetical protein Tco_1265624 [Tanacetum coccineum]